MIQRGQLRLPEMQRRYVWRSTRVRDLLDSLYRGYWRQDKPRDQRQVTGSLFAADNRPARRDAIRGSSYSDGEQRVGSRKLQKFPFGPSETYR